MKNSAIYSAILHVVVFILLIVGVTNPFERTVLDQNTMVIEFETISDKSMAPIISPKPAPIKELTPPKPVKQEPQKPQEPTKQEEPKPQKVEPPKPEPIKPEKIIEPEEEGLAPVVKPKPKPKEVEQQKPVEKPKPRPNLDKALKNLDPKDTKPNNSKDQPKEKPKKTKEVNMDDVLSDVEVSEDDTPKGGARVTEVGPVISASEIDAVRQKIRQCWIVQSGAKNAKDLVVDLDLTIAKDGTVTAAQVSENGKMADPAYAAAAESAKRAVLNPDCNPLPLSEEKYDQWKNLTLTFNPKDMF